MGPLAQTSDPLMLRQGAQALTALHAIGAAGAYGSELLNLQRLKGLMMHKSSYLDGVIEAQSCLQWVQSTRKV